MSKHNNKKSRLKYVFLAFTCATAFAFSGIASACGNSSSDEEKDKTTTKEDTQLLKNGNFEFFTIPDKKEDGNKPEYLIKSVENWSHGGTNSYTMSGIISTSKMAWEKISDPALASTLDANNELDSSQSNYLDQYVDYNGMKSRDILYEDQYKALLGEDDDDYDETYVANVIENPGTHYNVHGKEGEEGLFAYVDGEEVPVYVDNDEDSKTYGDYFLEYDEESGEYSQPISNILMLHNYATSHNGIAQNYSSVSLELPANTAAEISVWVKTAFLKHDQGLTVDQNRGANISVTQTVGSSTLDKFMISCINTEKLLGLKGYDEDEKVIDDDYNGWVQYTVYVNACDFASTTIKIELGLGETGYTTEGYAFFDDVSVTKFVSLDDSSYSKLDDGVEVVSCNLSSDESEKIFKADIYKRNEDTDEPVYKKQYAKNFHYLIDLASEQPGSDNRYKPVTFKDVENLTVGLTVDDDNYVSSKSEFKPSLIGFTDTTSLDFNCRLPFSSEELKNKGLKTENDLLAYVPSDYVFNTNETIYADTLNKALGNASKLPKNSDNNDMLVMLSSFGAAYTSSFELPVPRNENGSEYGGYQIVSFWVKTSDMGGSTAATIKITQTGKDENTASFTLDTTDKVTNIGDTDEEKDIYDGWVQCFFFVKNELEAEDDKNTGDYVGSDNYTIEFSFGNTTINGTDVHSYKSGWVALANMQYLNVDEDIFSYTSSGSYTASLTISEEAEKNTQAFDSAYGNQSQAIKNDMVNASSYKGVNGGSSAIVNNGHVSIPFDAFNNNVDDDGNKFTGLINKEYFVEENYKDLAWYGTLLNNFNASGIDALAAWNKIFGEKSYQPLIITNKKRTSYVEFKDATEETFLNYWIKDKETGKFTAVSSIENAEFDKDETYYKQRDVINYGYIGDSKTVSSDSYSTISVRVKVSEKATAYVYLVDTSAGKDVLSFSAPSYSFYYDVDGNVLKDKPKDKPTLKEQRENIAYTLRDDGLYEDEDGNLYANLYNYSKLYYLENVVYYDVEGNEFSIENLVGGVTYYKDKEHQIEADHYLITSNANDKDKKKVYQCIDGVYHYIVEGQTQSEVVNNFDTTVAHPRYNLSGISEEYFVEIKGSDHLDDKNNPEWVTVTFVLHAGSESKSYRLELWSGKRDETETDGNEEGGTVIFDYSYASISSDDVKNEWEKEIINEYLKVLNNVPGALDKIDTTGKNIAYFEELVKDLLSEHPEYESEYPELLTITPYNYTAHYYTYSLYDSANFQPFNKEVASDEATGYDYSAADQSESLAYLRVESKNAYSVFVDYSAIDQSISLNNASDTDDDNDDDSNSGSNTSIWLLASSIILVVALIFAIIAIFLKDVIKKARRSKVTSKNQYDQRKANRYKRKLHLKSEQIVEVDADEAADTDTPEVENEAPVEEVPEVTEDVVEEPVEEATPEEPSDDSDKQE